MAVYFASITKPFSASLTAEAQEERGFLPIVAGDAVALRFQVRDAADEAVSLKDGFATMAIRVGQQTIFRRSDTTITGSAPPLKQIMIDADQDNEDEANQTGKGYFQVNFAALLEDFLALSSVAGEGAYQIVIKPEAGPEVTFLRGPIEVLGSLLSRPAAP